MPEQVKGGTEHLEEENEEHHMVVPQIETKPTLVEKGGCLLRSAPTSIIGTCTDLTAHHTISLCSNSISFFV